MRLFASRSGEPAASWSSASAASYEHALGYLYCGPVRTGVTTFVSDNNDAPADFSVRILRHGDPERVDHDHNFSITAPIR